MGGILREPDDEIRDQYRLRLERANRLAESLEAELRTLRADKERLDWLEKEDPMCWGVVDPEGWSPHGSCGDPTYPSLRAAIDTAKEKT